MGSTEKAPSSDEQSIGPSHGPSSLPLLELKNLTTVFRIEWGSFPAVDAVNLSLAEGETLGLVGESGCGKTTLALSILRLIRLPGEIVAGEVLLQGKDLRKLSGEEMRRIRGRRIAMVFQEPISALNPLMRIGRQLSEGMQVHLGYSKRQAWERGAELLREVGIADPGACMNAYPHELSGGMRQRVLIAMALACDPELLIADEPTTALDVTVQAQILQLLRELKKNRRLSLLMISHDLGVIADVADQVAVMYAGQVVEYGSADDVFYRASHPYTQKLLSSVPRISAGRGESLKPVPGSVPGAGAWPRGCRFHPRCPEADWQCGQSEPLLFRIGEQIDPPHQVRCLKREHLRS